MFVCTIKVRTQVNRVHTRRLSADRFNVINKTRSWTSFIRLKYIQEVSTCTQNDVKKERRFGDRNIAFQGRRWRGVGCVWGGHIAMTELLRRVGTGRRARVVRRLRLRRRFCRRYCRDVVSNYEWNHTRRETAAASAGAESVMQCVVSKRGAILLTTDGYYIFL